MTSETVLGAPKMASLYRPREYQLEMLEASMKENIIVAVYFLFLLTYIY